MVEILLALLLYALVLDCALKKASVDVGGLPSSVRRRTLGGLLLLRPPVVLRRASTAPGGRR
jgi:hypothetical protein